MDNEISFRLWEDTQALLEFIGTDYDKLLDVLLGIISRSDVDNERAIGLYDFIKTEQSIIKLTNK